MNETLNKEKIDRLLYQILELSEYDPGLGIIDCDDGDGWGDFEDTGDTQQPTADSSDWADI
jgi:hypothetical protein